MTDNKTIIFDLGNVILDFSHNMICEQLARISRYSSEEIYKIIFESGLERIFDEGRISSEEFYRKIINKLQIQIYFDAFSKIWNEVFSENKETASLIKELKKSKIKLILLSNTNQLHFEYCKNKYDVLDSFDEFVLSYKVGESKPSSKIFQVAIEKSKSLPKNIIFIDDLEENISSAKEMGINCILFNSAAQCHNEIIEIQNDIQINIDFEAKE